MKLRTLGKTLIVVALVSATAAGARATWRWFGVRARFAEGQQALARRDFAQAASRFQAALDLDPRSTRARVGLATAYAAQFVPGGESAANVSFATRALDELGHAVESEPANAAAVRAIAAIHEGRLGYDEARTWYRRLVALAPANADDYASASALACRQVSDAILIARVGAGFPPDDDRPLPDAGLRQGLAARWSAEIEDGLAVAARALGLDPQHDGAMATASAWHRLRGTLADTVEKHRQDAAAADQWMRKALAARRAKAERSRP